MFLHFQPANEGNLLDKNTPRVPTVDTNKSMSDSSSSSRKVEAENKLPQIEPVASTSGVKNTQKKEGSPESKAEVNRNGKMKFSESRKSPVLGSFKPMTFHSTPNKEGKPLTKTMVDLQLDPNRHSDNVKKTIEVHTENIKQKPTELPAIEKDTVDKVKSVDTVVQNEILTEKSKEVANKQEVIKDSPKKEHEPNETEVAKCNSAGEILEQSQAETAKCIESIGDKSEINIDKEKDTIAKELATDEQIKDSTTRNITKESVNDNIKSVKKNRDVLEITKTLINDKDNTVVPSKPDKSVASPPGTSKEDNKAAISASVTGKKLETTSKPETPVVKQLKPVDMDVKIKPIPKINIVLEKPSENKNDLAESIVEAALPVVVEKCQNNTHENKEVEKDKASKIKILENISLNFSTKSNLADKPSTVKDRDESTTNPDDDNMMKFPLESFSEVSSTCANLGSEESNEESITLYSIDTDESVSLKTPSTTTKISDDKVILSDKISEVLTTIGNLSNIQTEDTSVEQKPVVPENVKHVVSSTNIMKESTVQTKEKSESDSTCRILKQASCSKLEKTETAVTSYCQKGSKEHNITFPETKLAGKATSSISVPKVKDSEKSATCTSVPKEKPAIIGHPTIIKLKPALKETQSSLVPEIKPSGKVAFSEIKPLAKAPHLSLASHANSTEKKAKPVLLQDDKLQPALKPESKPPMPASVLGVNPVEKKYPVPPLAKISNTTTIPAKGKQSEIPTTTSNKTGKSDSHIPVVSVANKPSSKLIPVLAPKVEAILKPVDNAVSQKDTTTKNIMDKKSAASETREIKEPIRKPNLELKPVNNNHTAAVPFGKWTDAHRQEFVNKFKEVKAPLNSNSKQIKNSNDLNRRDVLQKIDSQRAQTISNATAKGQEKVNVKSETVFSSKVVSPTLEAKTLPISELADNKLKQDSKKVVTKQENSIKTDASSTSYATDVNVKTHVKTKPGPTGKITAGKIEPAPREQITVTKTEPVLSEQSTVGKIEAVSRERSAVGKTESVLRENSTVGKTESVLKEQSAVGKKEPVSKEQSTAGQKEPAPRDSAAVNKTETGPRDTASCYMASLIDKTIEDMINKVAQGKNADEPKQAVSTNTSDPDSNAQKPISKPTADDSVSLDDIEMKMNELHGIPFVERLPHELPKPLKPDIKTYSKIDKIKPVSKTTNTNSAATEPKLIKDLDSDEELIEHEPITGDLDLKTKTVPIKIKSDMKKNVPEKSKSVISDKCASNKDVEIITETDFDKFARRNSITYENCLTVSFDRKESQNVVQTVTGQDLAPKMNPKIESSRNEVKSKLPIQTVRHHVLIDKTQGGVHGGVAGDSSTKKYQSKIHSAYQSALTAKHQVARPISIIEDKPVKVVFLESSIGFVPSQLNVQGQELSPSKKPEIESDITANNDSVDSGMSEAIYETKQQDKTKTKHLRKQVLTPVEAPDLELIQPSDIGIEIISKKKRKLEDIQAKNLVPKKSYLLARNATTENKTANTQILVKDNAKDVVNRSEDVSDHKDTASAIDNLVKAAELLENQDETVNKSISPNPAGQTNTPVKRGRGRPRKYPLPDGAVDNKSPSPQKKPRLIDAKPIKQDSISDDQDDDSSDEAIVRENWTMGKINENIVCPICNKLFRSENVVFKHVKHCTGVSPNRSESDKKSPRRSRLSQESDDTDYEMFSESIKDIPKKRKSKESTKSDTPSDQTKLDVSKDDVIVIEDTPIKEKAEKLSKEKEEEPKKESKAKDPHRNKSLVCEFCGKTFRQLSYLTSHKLQHKKDLVKKKEQDAHDSNKLQVFSCEVCKKEFRKLHHLVQHRINHNLDTVPKRTLRKSLSEQNDTKNHKEDAVAKQVEDTSAGFRCEPCDKSFRKLHHLVEHRGTHDGINRQKPSAPMQPTREKSPSPPQCEVCKKTFRKLHHLIEHKEQHADTSSDKSDDKSSKSALSTKDIIHECSLCYMVFPNEHSLNKHSANCSKKKRQSKQLKDTTEKDLAKDDENLNSEKKDEIEGADIPKIVIDDDIVAKEQNSEEVKQSPEVKNTVEVEDPVVTELKQVEDEKITPDKVPDKPSLKEEANSIEIQSTPAKRDLTNLDLNREKENPVVPEKIKKIDLKEVINQDIPKKKTALKDKGTPSVSKRQKSLDAPLSDMDTIKPSVESSDDDEIRYMLNPNFKVDETSQGKSFMKVRARKRNSLQIERPNSNDHAKRRTSLQLPPKVTRLKPKAVETKSKAVEPKLKVPESNAKSADAKSKPIENKTSTAPPMKSKHVPKLSEAEAVLSTDSDDSDVKYSFPKTAPDISKPAPEQTSKETEKKSLRKSLAEKRKSLGGIAKRKSGKAITAKHKVNLSPPKPIKKRKYLLFSSLIF